MLTEGEQAADRRASGLSDFVWQCADAEGLLDWARCLSWVTGRSRAVWYTESALPDADLTVIGS